MLKAIQYLDSLIAGQRANSEIPVQLSELELLRKLMEPSGCTHEKVNTRWDHIICATCRAVKLDRPGSGWCVSLLEARNSKR